MIPFLVILGSILLPQPLRASSHEWIEPRNCLCRDQLAIRTSEPFSAETVDSLGKRHPLLRNCKHTIQLPNYEVLHLPESLTTDEEALAFLRELERDVLVLEAAPIYRSSDGITLIPTAEAVINFAQPPSVQEIAFLKDHYRLRLPKKQSWSETIYTFAFNGTAIDLLDLLPQIEESPAVSWAWPNHIQIVQPLVNPCDLYFDDQWYFTPTNLPAAWDIQTGTEDIVIAIVDDGVDLNHPDLVDKLLPPIDAFAADSLPFPRSVDAHGTHCAGVAAAMTNNGEGVSGTCWGARLLPVRVYYHVDEAAYATEISLASGIAHAVSAGADVISMSFVGARAPLIDAALAYAKFDGREGKGCVLVAGAGNSGGPVEYPASSPGVIAVGAVDQDNQRWQYSCHGPEIDLVAPSGDVGGLGDIWTTDLIGSDGDNPGEEEEGDAVGNYWSHFGGTSAATPQVAGVAALVLSENPSWTSDEVETILKNRATDLGTAGFDDYYGHGLVNAQGALAPVTLSGYYYDDLTLPAGLYTVTGTAYFIDSHVVFDAGVIMKMGPGARLVFDNAILHAVGTPGDSIVVTSFKDDNYGGDTNGDGELTAPEAGDWNRILFSGSGCNESLLMFCSFLYGGGGSDDLGLIWCDNSGNGLGLTVRDSRIGHSPDCGIYCGDDQWAGMGSSPEIWNCFIHDCAIAPVGLSSNSFPQISNNRFLRNGIQGYAILGGSLYHSGTWHRGDYPYAVLSSVDILVGSTLTLEAGSIFKFGTGCSIGTAEGTLRAVGAPGDSVVLTSLKDDEYGGDTNADGMLTTPAEGDWSRVYLSNGDAKESILHNCIIRYAVRGVHCRNTGAGIGPIVRGCRIGKMSGYGVYCGDDTYVNLGSSPEISKCIMEDCEDAAVGIFGNSFPWASENLFRRDGIQGLAILSGSIQSSGTWYRNEYPYVLIAASVEVPEGAMLLLEPGVIVKSSPGGVLNVLDGTIRAVGSIDCPIIFTSLRDDVNGGDTNNDGALTGPQPADWDRVRLRGSSAESILRNCTFRYGGSGPFGTLTCAAIVGTNGPQVDSCRFELTNAIGVYVEDAPDVALHHNAFIGDSTWVGVINTSSAYEIDAIENWWGDGSGPYDPSEVGDYNPLGLGCRVSDYVLYRPWITDSEPILHAVPAMLQDSCQVGGEIHALLTLANLGTVELQYSIEEAMGGVRRKEEGGRLDVEWIEECPAHGRIEPGREADIDVIMHAADLGPGIYSCYLAIESNDAVHSPWIVPVQLSVAGPAAVPGLELEEPASILVVHPQPSDGSAYLSYHFDAPADVSYRLFDVAGRLIRDAQIGEQPAGTHRLSIAGEALPPGIYYLQFEVGRVTGRRRVCVIR